ncbi:sugar kinase [Tersicoccus sp. MR15.9]|uniref:sugar kinase n=1 Tax=Tersicoccus mangrovi TaxID=3121635 RepID=UPI002FE5A194
MPPHHDIPDVLVLGEILVELTSAEPLAPGAGLTLGISGDALNVAAAAAAAAARTLLVARVPDDELGDAIVRRCTELGIDTSALVRGPGQHGLYLSHSDPDGEREFLYARRASFGSTVAPEDLPAEALAGAGVVTASGIASAVSATAAATVRAAAEGARRFVYDPNLRPRLTTVEQARAQLQALAPHCEVVKPSWPTEVTRLLGLPAGATEEDALAGLRALGVADVVLTRGARGAVVADASGVTAVPIVPAPVVKDQTGAGDSFTGTLCARLALGDTLLEAVRLASAAASLSVGGIGGTGLVPTLTQTREHLNRAARIETTLTEEAS